MGIHDAESLHRPLVIIINIVFIWVMRIRHGYLQPTTMHPKQGGRGVGESSVSIGRLNGCFSLGLRCVCDSLLLPLPAGAHMQAAERPEDYLMSGRDAGS